MKKLILLFSGAAMLFGSSTDLSARCCDGGCFDNDADRIPLLTLDNSQWERIEDVAQYKEADWSNVIGKAENVSLQEAIKIAENDPNITYFFYVKGYMMVLENLSVEPALWRIFRRGDAVFFIGDPWWGTAPGLADGYVKKDATQN